MKQILKISVLWAALGLPACGASPLLHHAQAPASVAPEAPAAPEAASAPVCAVHFARTQTCASVTWEAQPTAESEGVFVMQFFSSQGLMLNLPYSVEVQLWMPSMGHGSAPVTVTALGGGAYRVSRVYFVMPGDWEIRVQLKGGAQAADQGALAIHI